MAGEPAGWVNFRRDALRGADGWGPAAKAVKLAMALGLAMAILLPVTMLVRANRYDRKADDLVAQQQAIYRQIMPNRPVPSGAVRRYIDAEFKRLYGVSGLAQDVPTLSSALNGLRRVLRALPEDVRFNVSELRLDQDGVLLEGQARNHPDALVLAQSLRQGGVLVEAPRTERQGAEGVGFVMSGPLRADVAAQTQPSPATAPVMTDQPEDEGEPATEPADQVEEAPADDQPQDMTEEDQSVLETQEADQPAVEDQPAEANVVGRPHNPWMQRTVGQGGQP
jgi:hypothetical protein